MIYGRHQLDKLGDALIGDAFSRSEALEKVGKWRETHLPVLSIFCDALVEFFNQKSISYLFHSQRIKRMTSIIAKLENNQEQRMRLGGLQDIGGIRFVFEDIDSLLLAQQALEDFNPSNFTMYKHNDYVVRPKDSGYRSIHYVYKYSCEDKTYDGISIELQIRTRLQHSWAMAVETASLISNTPLKANIEDDSEWRDFFRLVSAVFSKKENKPIIAKYKDATDEELCRSYFVYYYDMKLLDKLKTLRVTINQEFPTDLQNGYCVLSIDFIKQIVTFRTYDKDNEIEASNAFIMIENSLTNNEAALMVSIAQMQEIREAYPSYFLDTKEFINSLDEFNKACQIYR